MSRCSVDACERKVYGLGFCNYHWQRHRRGDDLTRPYGKMVISTVRDEHGNKQCKWCDEWLAESEFYGGMKNCKDGLRPECKGCSQASRHGVTKADLLAILESQGRKCPICYTAVFIGSGCNIDHDHACCPGEKSCGQCIRGVVCSRCNRGLGQFLDDATVLNRASQYLANWAWERLKQADEW